MNIKSRLHLYPSKGPKSQSYIVGERAALLALSEKLRAAAQNPIGIDQISLYSSDGHDYNILITSKISEDEWQNFKDPEDLNIIKTYNQVKHEVIEQRKDKTPV